MSARRDRVVEVMRAGQDAFGRALEECDGGGRFTPHRWSRPGGGGGEARILEDGRVFERAGVNVSAVYGDEAPASIAAEHGVDPAVGFFATGLSTVVHPRNPHVPSFHANFRYFEMGDQAWWFGGGADLTPAYGYAEDAAHFHRTLKDYCDGYGPAFYPEAKTACDEYFYLPHRRETRGVGGIFFDGLRPDGPDGWDRGLRLAARGIETLAAAYLPIVRRRTDQPYGDRERQWQLYRRGRYVEFNLVYDRGTRFGLQTGGNIEAILMSLPPLASWAFDVQPEPGTPEAEMRDNFLTPRDWASPAR
ncbi:coproporphyrinogen III oxidase [Actinoplanes tereljensis]|uniref:coproporphyrinogen oxidase n=1 Tax=Paractinoplanes tereljensis TaxID=571912 RepID=A0A919NWA7_9ACTN|nr:oxygen-dependent coproporphyrinogen oxidase [Actinoplanes tereljensis]GIF26499.1 coproporphyrinogen oxidase [Actinoplanes tereljensis]